MEHSRQIELIHQALSHLKAGTTDTSKQLYHQPVSVYTEPERLNREWERLFRRGPQYLGFSCLLPNPGDYLTDDYLGVPILLVRGAGGELNAFINACRHRGTRLAEGSGNGSRTFTCPYHGWSYDTAGKLLAVPSRNHFDSLDPENCSLHRLHAFEAFGMMWVVMDKNAKDAEDAVAQWIAPELRDELDSYQLDQYHPYRTESVDLNCNWKLAVDTFLEPYHFPVLHKKTVGPIFHPNLCLFTAFGKHLREVFPRRTIEQVSDQPEDQWDLLTHSAIVYVLFPNTVYVMQRDHAEVWRILPDKSDPGRCTVLLSFYIPEPATTDKARKHWDANLDLALTTVLEEDFPVSNGAQTGFESGYQSELVFGQNEPALAHFESQVAKAVG